MADVKISALSASAALTGTEVLPIVQGGVTVKTTTAAIAALAAGGVSSVNGQTGVVVLDTDDIAEGATNLYSTYANINTGLGLPANVMLFANAASEVVGYGEYNVNETTKFLGAQLFYQPNALSANPQAFTWNVNVAPLQNSPNDGLTVFNLSANLDSSATGFSMGTAGNSVTLLNAGFSANGNGSTYGRLVYQNWNTGFGNGTDPFTLQGLSGIFIGGNAAANVTIDGAYAGYTSSLSMDALALSTANFSVSGYSETSQLATANVYGYNAFFAQPNIGTIKNNHNFNGLTINPSITNLELNAGFYGAIIGGTITNQGTNGYFGIQVNPTITHLTSNSYGISVTGQTTDGTANWAGITLSSNSIVTTGEVKVLEISTATGHTAIDSSGHNFLNVGVTLANGLGQANGNVIGGQVTIPNGTAITSTDFFGNNLAFSVNLGDATSSFASSSPVGISSVGFVGQVLGDGDADLINFLLNGYAGVFNGNVTRINNTHNACFPNSGTGILAESVMMLVSQPAGPVGTDNWGFRAESAHLENYLPKLAIGTANKKVDSSYVLDIVGETQVKNVSTDAGAYGHYVNLTSHTTADGSNELFAFTSENFATVAATFTNSKVLAGSSQSVTRGDGTDDGTLSGLCGHESIVKINSGAAGVTSDSIGFLSLIFAQSGLATDVYHFRGQTIEAGATITNQYGIYLAHDATTPLQNWISGSMQLGGTSYTLPGHDVVVDGELQAQDYYSADDTQGATATVLALGLTNLQFKNGLFVGSV